jgi:hypothetical protein
VSLEEEDRRIPKLLPSVDKGKGKPEPDAKKREATIETKTLDVLHIHVT